MDRFERSLPRKFLRKWDLHFGSRVVCLVFAAICLICIIAASIYCVQLGNLENETAVIRNSYAITLVAIIFCIIFLLACLALYRALERNHRPTMLTWVLIAVIWWIQAFLLCLIATFMYRTSTSCGVWFLYLLLVILAFTIMAYGISVVFAYWRQQQIAANLQYQPRQWKPPGPTYGPPPAAPAAPPAAPPAASAPASPKK